ncbi:hypothetical protein TSUD_12670 [Trifolium subterraneum]|uniref:TF-B3 domain-containing protein n=1 Tax=Trifolium subterraneum TaxID=3900 RepID=A0A2Z6P4B8_TRISU|nr:hypothetical protein TSUD_12670 [Trifolium subterraneum]
MSLYCGPPKFFKIIQNHELQNHELRVPKKFVEKHWKGIPNPVVIKLPNGVDKKLFWVKHDGDIWFQKNWDKIAKYLKFGYVVVFKYMGGSCFQLEIFGLNALEIDYSIFIDQVKRQVEFDEDESDEDESDDEESDEDEYEIMKQKRTTKRKRKIDEDESSGSGGRIKKVRKCSSRDNDANPFFEIELSDYYTHGNFLMIPSKFSREHLNKFVGTATLQVGKEMPIKVNMKFDAKNRRSTIGSGWKLFRKEYNLQVEDSCKFVMIQRRPSLVFNVIITRVMEGASGKKLRGWREVGNNSWMLGK